MNNPYLEEYHKINSFSHESFTAREKLVKKYAWAIPTDAALSSIRSYAPLIEIGAGKGYWASLLDCDIICFDINEAHYVDGDDNYFDVQLGGPEKVLEHPERTLFLCWPPYAEPMAADCLKNYKGDTLLFIGEGYGGCTGDDEFWNMIRADWTEEDYLKLPQWFGIHDCLMFFKRDEE